MTAKPQDIEFPVVELKHCSTEEHCRALQEAGNMPFWWYQDLGRFGGNHSLPFKGNLGYWWYQVRPGFAWPVDALDPMPCHNRVLRFRSSYLGYQHIVPPTEPSNSTLVINTIRDLPRYGAQVINDKRRNAIRKGFRACEVFAVQSVDQRWLDGAVRAWNDLVDRTGWKHHRDAKMLRESWERLLRQPAATILLAMDRATGGLAGFLITKVYGRTAYVDTIASNTELLKSNPNDVLMYTFIRNAQRIPGVELLHFAIKSTVEPLERFKTSIGCVPYPYPAMLHTRPGMMMALRIVKPKLYMRLTGKDPHADEQAAETAPEAWLRQMPAGAAGPAAKEMDGTRAAAAAVKKSWYIAPYTNPPTGWQVYSLNFVLAAMQGSLTEPYQIKKSMQWLVFGTIVRSLMAVSQAIIMLLAWIPIISSFLEVMARTFTRNAAGFFLRSCYWKARLGSLGGDTLIDQGVEIWGPANVSIGSHCHIDTNVRLAAGERRHRQRGSIFIGDYVHVGPNVHISGRGGVAIGNLVGISAAAHLYSATNMVESPSDPGELISMSHMAPRDQQHVYEAPIVVEDHAFIGMMARILPGVRIGEGAIIHAAAEVTRDVPCFANFGGLPRGRQIGWRKPRRPSPKLAVPPAGEVAQGGEGAPRIRKIDDPNDWRIIENVADLHRGAFSQGIMTQLGGSVVGRYYRGILSSRSSSLWVAELDGAVVGFLGTTTARHRLESSLLSVGTCLLAVWRLASLRLSPWAVLRFFRKRHRGKAFRDSAQLLSIVVAPHLRRAGLGKRFLDLWMEELRAADIPSFIVFTDNIEGLYFYRKHGGDCLFQFHLRSMLSACFRLHVTKPTVNTQSV